MAGVAEVWEQIMDAGADSVMEQLLGSKAMPEISRTCVSRQGTPDTLAGGGRHRMGRGDKLWGTVVVSVLATA
eukprot:7425848-Pyramimonas_sp.AAC.1